MRTGIQYAIRIINAICGGAFMGRVVLFDLSSQDPERAVAFN